MSEPVHFMDVLRCTHGADCLMHPDVQGLHNFEPTAAQALREVLDQLHAGLSGEDAVAVAAESLGVQL